MPTWVIQCVDSLVMRDGWVIAEYYELLFVDRFTNENGFAAALHEGGITGVAQDDDDQDYDNDDDDRNTNEDPYNPTGIDLNPAEACSKISRVPPENPVEIPG